MKPPLVFTRRCEIGAPVEALREWHFQPGAFERLTPPWERARVLESPFPLVDGSRALIEVGMGPLRLRWLAVHELTERGFIDRQIEGPFAFWEHHHHFDAIDETRSLLTDTIHYRLPFGWPGQVVGRPLIEKKLDRLFSFRHEVTAAELSQKST